MSAPDRRKLVLGSETHRQFVGSLVATSPPGSVVTIDPPRRTLDQNAFFHSLCGDIAKSGYEWFGKRRTQTEWKVLLVSAHASATGTGCDMVQGLEGELVQLRESTAEMDKPRSSSLIEYTISWCASHDIKIRDADGWLAERERLSA